MDETSVMSPAPARFRTALPVRARTLRAQCRLCGILAVLCASAACSSEPDRPRLQAFVEERLFHTHTVHITFRLLESGVRSFPLEENAGHNHTLELSEEDAALLLIGAPVTRESSEAAGHRHGTLLQAFQQAD